jgi:hypothetical protein
MKGSEKPFATLEDGYAGLKMVSGVVESSECGTIIKFY